MKNVQQNTETFDIVRHTPQANINKIKFQGVRESVLAQSISENNDMTLTIDILDASVPALIKDDGSMDAVCQCVERWQKENNSEYAEVKWQTDLIQFATEHDDVVGIYASARDADNYEFIMIMDDVTNARVFEYNEFCFTFAEMYVKVTDFMVIDNEEAQGCHDLLKTYEMIYKRG